MSESGAAMSRLKGWLLTGALLVSCSGVWAQDNSEPGQDFFSPNLVDPGTDFSLDPPSDSFAPVPYAPSTEATQFAPLTELHKLELEARLIEGSAPLTDGIAWRVFGTQAGPDGELPLVATQKGGTTTVHLAAGTYLVHAAFGRAGATKRVSIADGDQKESVILDAGGLKLDAVVGDDEPVSADVLTFEILREDEDGELVTVVPKATPRLVLRLAAGAYHVISRYGDVNAVVRADIQVEPGKLTEAVMRHTGAEVTLKLVSDQGGEALANTSWTVLNQDGTTLHESIGAFPSLVLAEGNYTAIASHQDEVYSRDFSIEAGVDRDIEVQLSDLVAPDAGDRAGPGVPSEPVPP
jgi:hypothetical protein